MEDNQREALRPKDAHLNTGHLFKVSEEDKSGLYRDILFKEATSLLAKYLPEAFPQEPTEIFIGVLPQYLGKFKDKHYISLERDPEFDPLVQILKKALQDMEWMTEQNKLSGGLENERLRLIKDRAEKGNFDFTDIDEKINHEQELIQQMPKPEPKTATKLRDWQDPERLLQGPSQFSIDSWRGVYMLVHELIHQRQAELNPFAFPVLVSSELDSIDPENADRNLLYNLLVKAHKAHSRTQNDSLFYPVIEGMAVLGAFYIMGRFADDIAKVSEKDAADRIREVKRSLIHNEIVAPKRDVRRFGEYVEAYAINFAEGVDIMRKMYKNFGLENMPKILITVDLSACRQINKGSPEYQQIMENPALLPGLPRGLKQ